MRRCKLCRTEIKTASKCTDIVEKKGYCSVKCLAEHTAEKRIKAQERKERKAMREAKERVKPRSQWLKEAQTAFNAYIRERDKDQPCISCGSMRNDNYLTGSNWDAGHYRSRAACPELRFHEDNFFKQCVACNRDKSGNVVDMRLGILKRIGKKRLDWIEGPHETKKYTIDELKQIKAEYKAKLKALKSVDI